MEKLITYRQLILLFWGISFNALVASAQSYLRPENNIWLSGGIQAIGEGIDFNSGSPVPVSSSWQTTWLSGSASVCDAQGNLLFYSDGTIVWDRNNNIMLNGWDINNNGNMTPNTFYIDPTFGMTSSNYDGVVIMPMPGSSHRYYIFCSPFLYLYNGYGYLPNWTGNLYGTVVDMELNNGLGGVDPNYRGILLADSMAGNLHAVIGENCDSWLLGFGANGSYKAFHITAEGFNPVPVVSTLTPPLSPYVSELNMAPNRRKAAMACGSEVQVADFDPATGQFSNDILIGTQVTSNIAFSPNSQLIYLSGLIGLRQYDLNNLATPLTLLTFNNLTDYEYDAPLRLGPDNKIYLSYYHGIPGGSESVGAHILQPDVFGTGCQLELIQNTSLPLLETGWWGIDYLFPNEIPVLTYDTTSRVKHLPLCFHEPELLQPEDTSGTDYHWMANTVGTTYIRKGGDSTKTWLATDPGTYAIQYFSSNPCTFHQDTFIVKGVSFSLYLGPDQISCEGEPIALKADVPGGSYLWPDGSTGSSYEADTFGRYWVQVSKEGCTASDSINVAIIDINQDLGADTALCFEEPGEQLTLTAKLSPGASVLWSTGSTQSQIRTSDSGLYWVQVTNKDCIGSDSIYVHRQYCDCPMLLPTAFSPNGDGSNDEYKPALPGNCPVAEYKLQVYNRWGKMLFVSYDPDQGWDGTINGKPADTGTYYYHLQMKTGLRKQDMSKSGDFTLLR